MCGCQDSFVCSRCQGTPFDPYYELEAPEPLTLAEFDVLVEQYVEPWSGEFA